MSDNYIFHAQDNKNNTQSFGYLSIS